MSVWMTKSSEISRNYIVLQHTLKGVNHTVNGIKFRDGYAVIEKGSKVYFHLKKIPVLKSAKEYPLSHLRKLSFITRTSDIRTVYGQDVYVKFLEEEQKEKELQQRLVEEKRELELQLKLEHDKKLEEAQKINDQELIQKLEDSAPIVINCCHRTKDGTLCKDIAVDYSPSNYCAFHLLEDPKLSEFDLEPPRFMTKDERRDFRHKVKSTLKKLKSQEKF